jgi:hypothetical protein
VCVKNSERITMLWIIFLTLVGSPWQLWSSSRMGSNAKRRRLKFCYCVHQQEPPLLLWTNLPPCTTCTAAVVTLPRADQDWDHHWSLDWVATTTTTTLAKRPIFSSYTHTYTLTHHHCDPDYTAKMMRVLPVLMKIHTQDSNMSRINENLNDY